MLAAMHTCIQHTCKRMAHHGPAANVKRNQIAFADRIWSLFTARAGCRGVGFQNDCHKNMASWKDSQRRCWVDSPTVSWSSPLAVPAPFLRRIPTALDEARHIFIFLTARLRPQPGEMKVCVGLHIPVGWILPDADAQNNLSFWKIGQLL